MKKVDFQSEGEKISCLTQKKHTYLPLIESKIMFRIWWIITKYLADTAWI